MKRSEIRMDTYLSIGFLIQNGQKQRYASAQLFLNFLEYALGMSRTPGGTEIELDTSASGSC
jgi:hypothetical protein